MAKCSRRRGHKVPAGQAATTKPHLLSEGNLWGMRVWGWSTPLTPPARRCFMNMFYGSARDFYPTASRKTCLPGICCQITTAGQCRTCCSWPWALCVCSGWRWCWPGRSLQAFPASGYLLCGLARDSGKDLTCKVSMFSPPRWEEGRHWGPWDAWAEPELEETSRVLSSTSDSNSHTNIVCGKCLPSLPLETPGTSPDPPPQLQLCAVTPTSHSAVFCHPPSQSITFCLSSFVLFCFFFCSLPACSFSNFWHWFRHLLFLLILVFLSQILFMPVSSTVQAVQSNQLWKPFQTVFFFLERISKPNNRCLFN